MTNFIPRPGDPGVRTVYVSNMDREFHLTAREHALLLTVAKGRKFDQRTISRAVGYLSVSAVNKALRLFEKMGLGRLTTKRGRFGWTRFRISPDVLNRRRPLSNVLPTDSKRTLQPRETTYDAGRTFTPAADGMGAWRAVGEMLSR